jgi:hypothetical protein
MSSRLVGSGPLVVTMVAVSVTPTTTLIHPSLPDPHYPPYP